MASSNYYIPQAKLELQSNTTEQYVKMITEHAISQTATINKIHQALKLDDIPEEVIINIKSNPCTKQKDIAPYLKLQYDFTIKYNLLLYQN